MGNATLDIKLYLNMQMLVDALEDYDILAYLGNNRKQFLSCEIYYGQKKLSRNVLYVADVKEFAAHPIKDNAIGRVIVGALPDSDKDPGFPAIVVVEKVNWQEIYNLIQRTFLKYSSLNQKLLSIFDSGGGLYELCVAGVDFFDNPMYIHDENFNILAMPKWVVGMNDFNLDESTGNATVPLRTLKRLKVSPEYHKTLSKKKAALWNSKDTPHRVLYANIWAFDGRYCGRLLIQELNNHFKPSDFVMAEYFAKVLSIAFERNLFKTSNVTSFEEMLRNMYNGERYEDPYLENRMKMVGWSKDHRYLCFVTETEDDSHSVISLKKICSTAGIHIKNSFSFIAEPNVYTMCNLTLAEWTSAKCREAMEKLCEGIGLHSGGSMEFSDFKAFPAYCRQADRALAIGKEKGTGRVSLFRDNVLEYIITHFKNEFDYQMVCSDAVMFLRRFDEENKTAYLDTLRRYLNNGMQQTQTAGELFIHRSTLIYRINKIEEMTGIDLNDPDTRLYIQISIRLMDESV